MLVGLFPRGTEKPDRESEHRDMLSSAFNDYQKYESDTGVPRYILLNVCYKLNIDWLARSLALSSLRW
jgi:hypothetical protein